MTHAIAPARDGPTHATQLGGHRLKSLQIVSGFLDGTTFDLAAGLNCIIGARGTGKTTLLELIRFALDALPAPDLDGPGRRRIESLIERNLAGGRIQLTIETKDGLTYVVNRSPGEDPIVLSADGVATEITLRAGGLFKADIYSQNEVESIADRAFSQLLLLDNFEPDRMAEIAAQIRACEARLGTNANALTPLQQQIAGIADDLGTLPGVEEKLKGFANAGGSDAQIINQAHAAKSLRDRERRAVEELGTYLGEFGEHLTGAVGHIAPHTKSLLAPELLAGPNGTQLRECQQAIAACAAVVDTGLRQACDAIRQAQAALQQAGAALHATHAQQEMAFRSLIEKHQAAQTQAQERTRLEKLRNDLLAKRRQREELHTRLEQVRTERRGLLAQLAELRTQRSAIRQAVADRINAALSPTIRVSVVEAGNPEAYRVLLEDALRGNRLKHGVVAQKLINAYWPADLAAVIHQGDTRALVDRAELNGEQAERVMSALAGSPALFKLETVELSDLPRIELRDGAEYKDSASLSTGQKCTAILPILLLDSDNPLLVDQPEDNLDNGFIYETVVRSIRDVKKRRQLVFVTHNPNIPVLGDAEQVFVLESDGSTARVINQGTVDQCQRDIVTLLEGGEAAFKERKQRYNY